MHKRRIYRRLRTSGLRCHVPARLASLGLDYAISIRRLAPLALRLPPDHASRHRPCLRPVVILAHDESRSVLPQGTSTPQVRAHAGRTPLAEADQQRQATRPGLVVRGTFSPARAWHFPVVNRLAQTLGSAKHAMWCASRFSAFRREPKSHDAAETRAAIPRQLQSPHGTNHRPRRPVSIVLLLPRGDTDSRPCGASRR